MTAEAVSLRAQLARDTVGRWIRGTTLPTPASLQAVESVLGSRLGYTVDLSAAVRERRAGRHRNWSPAAGARHGEIARYLESLIRWLSADPWPRRFRGPELAPAAIERRLTIAEGSDGRQAQDADELGRRCTRLVVLGGPGSGKTWLARRMARLCAETALERLAVGDSVDKVELPLYTTCARIAAAPLADGIRSAVVTSALGLLPDVGGSQALDVVRALFEERDAPTLLVADSLDEARGADDRIHLADTLPPSWRIMLTTRPASWNHQLAIQENDSSHLVGILQPLRYPDDVEPFITAWFGGRPEQAVGIAAQLRDRPDLQRAATVPLILAFYCIVGGHQPLPGRRTELFDKVIRRTLTSRWRSGGDQELELDICLETLRSWAWTTARSDPVSGLGCWEDEFSAPPVSPPIHRDAVGNVAVPLGPQNPDTGRTPRQFVHRSIQEHLVAEHIAFTMPAVQAAADLLNHLWFDTDWEHAAPAALALHPQREEVLKELLCRVTGDDVFPADLTAIDGCWELRHFLAQVAAESDEAAWSPHAAALIGRARHEFVMSRPRSSIELAMVSGWPTSSQLILRSMLQLFADRRQIPEVADAAARLAVTGEDRTQLRQALLSLLPRQLHDAPARLLREAATRLAVTDKERAQVRQALLELLAQQQYPEAALEVVDAVTRLAVTDQEKAQDRQVMLGILSSQKYAWQAAEMAAALTGLELTADDRARARQVLLRLAAKLDDVETALDWATAIIALQPTAEDRAQVRQTLLTLSPRFGSHDDILTQDQLADMIEMLAVTGQDRAQIRREAIRRLIDGNASDLLEGVLEGVVARTATTDEERTPTLQALLARLASEDSLTHAGNLIELIRYLAVTVQDRAQTRQALLALAARRGNPWLAWRLMSVVTNRDPTAEDRAQARHILLSLLPDAGGIADRLAADIAHLDPTAEDRAQARGALLRLLADSSVAWLVRKPETTTLARLATTEDERKEARQALLRLLSDQEDPEIACHLAGMIAELHPTAEDRTQTLDALLRLLASQDESQARDLIDEAAQNAVTDRDREQMRQTLLRLLVDQQDPETAYHLARRLGELDPTAEDQARARNALLRLLTARPEQQATQDEAGKATQQAPTPQELMHAHIYGGPLPRLTVRSELHTTEGLVYRVAQLNPTADEQVQLRQALLRLVLTRDPPDAVVVQRLAKDLGLLGATEQELAQAREALLSLLRKEQDLRIADKLAITLTQLNPTASNQAQAREALIKLLENPDTKYAGRGLVDALAALNPSVEDLRFADRWARPLTHELLAAARKNSTPPKWVTALPVLSPRSQDE